MKRITILLLVGFLLSGCNNLGDSSTGDQNGGGENGSGGDDIVSTATVSLLPAGGSITVNDEISFEIEPGTVSFPIELAIYSLSEGVPGILAQSHWNDFVLLGGFKVDGAGIELDKPIAVTMNIEDLPISPGFPVVLKVDPGQETYSVAASEIEYDPDAGQVRFTLDSFSEVSVVLKENAGDVSECEQPETACRCGWIKVTTDASDYMTNSCQIVSQDIEIQFMSCPGQPIETDHMAEVLGCDWYGTFDYYMLTYDGSQLDSEWHFLMDVFFTLGEDGLYGAGKGTTDIDVYFDVEDCVLVKDEPDFDVIITGTWDAEAFHINLLPGEGMDGAQFGSDCGVMSELTVVNYGTDLRSGFMQRTWDIPHQSVTGHKEVLYSSGQDELALLVELVPGE